MKIEQLGPLKDKLVFYDYYCYGMVKIIKSTWIHEPLTVSVIYPQQIASNIITTLIR
jgi:hypothetical protein